MHLSHPETIPTPWSVGKKSSTKPVPSAETVGDRCSVSQIKRAGEPHTPEGGRVAEDVRPVATSPLRCGKSP